MKVLAIDPGTTTGLAWYLDGEFTTLATEADNVIKLLTNDLDWLVIERFATAGRISKYGLQTVNLVGQVKGWCYAFDKTLVIQSPQSRKAWQMQGDSFPKKTKPKLEHEGDAMAHLLQFLASRGIITKNIRF